MRENYGGGVKRIVHGHTVTKLYTGTLDTLLKTFKFIGS